MREELLPLNERVIYQTRLEGPEGAYVVSTVSLRLSAFEDMPGVLGYGYESMVVTDEDWQTGNLQDRFVERYATDSDARSGHNEIVWALERGEIDEYFEEGEL